MGILNSVLLKECHKVTLSMDGPFAIELDKEPKPLSLNILLKF